VDAGAVSPDTVAWTAHLKLPERLYETADLFALRWHEAFDPLPAIGKLMRELKKEGYGLYLLTNAGPSFDEYRDRIPGIDLFDGVVISCRERLVKPDARIYTLLCDRYQIAPESCLFVDDVEQNVVGAVRVGMSGHLFDGDIDALRDHIHALGPKVQFRRKGPFA
jgi:putative hydrolase of the HAD superfamily